MFKYTVGMSACNGYAVAVVHIPAVAVFGTHHNCALLARIWGGSAGWAVQVLGTVHGFCTL